MRTLGTNAPRDTGLTRRSGRWLLFRVALVVPTLIVLLLFEAGFRLHAYHADLKLREGLANLGSRPDADDLSLKHIIRWHDNSKIIYELIPGLRGEFRGHELTINDQGFRGPTVALPKPAGTYRIVGLGDSVMFGWGVADDAHYLSRLNERLRGAVPDRRFDWVNSAVPGYNTVNEVETLRVKLLGYEPDLVIVGFVRNDLMVPGFIRRPRPYLTLEYSYLARFVRNQLDGLHVPDNALQRPPDAFRRESFVGEEESIPERYRALIGIEAFRDAVAQLVELGREHGFRVLFFAHHGFDDAPERVLQSFGVETLSGYPIAREFLDARGIAAYRGSPLTVSAQDEHPSALYHDLLSGLLARHLLSTVEDIRTHRVTGTGTAPATPETAKPNEA